MFNKIASKIVFLILNILFISTSVNAVENKSYKGKDFYLDVNVGMATHDTGVSSVSGTTLDQSDTGFQLNLGKRFSKNWGLEGMYYDMGSASITGAVGDTFTLDGTSYVWNSAGTLTAGVTGFGGALVGYLPSDEWLEFYGKVGVHIWDQTGTATFLDNNSTFTSSFFDEGADLYFGLGVAGNVTSNIKLNIGYDMINFTDELDPSVDYYTTFLYAGIKYEF